MDNQDHPADYVLYVKPWSWHRRLRMRLGLLKTHDFSQRRGRQPYDTRASRKTK